MTMGGGHDQGDRFVACYNNSDVLNLWPREDFNLHPFGVSLKSENTTPG